MAFNVFSRWYKGLFYSFGRIFSDAFEFVHSKWSLRYFGRNSNIQTTFLIKDTHVLNGFWRTFLSGSTSTHLTLFKVFTNLPLSPLELWMIGGIFELPTCLLFVSSLRQILKKRKWKQNKINLSLSLSHILKLKLLN